MLRMYTLCLAGIIGLGLGATGCGSGGEGGGGYFDAAWDFESGATCASAGITEVGLDVLDTRTGLDYHDLFACSASQGTSEILPDDDYTVALRAYDSTNSIVSTADFGGAAYSIYAGTVTSLPLVAFGLHH